MQLKAKGPAPVASWTAASEAAPVRGTEVRSIEDIKRANARAGFYFFEPQTMRAFRSRALKDLFWHERSPFVYFVTSERQSDDHPRLYTVRRFSLKDSTVGTVGEFQAHATPAAARRAALEEALGDGER